MVGVPLLNSIQEPASGMSSIMSSWAMKPVPRVGTAAVGQPLREVSQEAEVTSGSSWS